MIAGKSSNRGFHPSARRLRLSATRDIFRSFFFGHAFLYYPSGDAFHGAQDLFYRITPAIAAIQGEAGSRGAGGKGMRANFIMTSTPLCSGLRRRYLALPETLLPKRQALYVRMPGAIPQSAKWNVQIGDGDGL